MVRGGDGSNAQRNEEEEGDLMVLSQKEGIGRVWRAHSWSEMDYFVPEVTIMSSFNLKLLKPASNLLKLQNIFSSTTPSYFKLFISLVIICILITQNFQKSPNCFCSWWIPLFLSAITSR